MSSHPRMLPTVSAEVTEKGFENVTPLKPCFLTVPMTFAPYVQGRPMLMLNALWDRYIPKQATLNFWEGCGEPDITWLPATQATIWLEYPFISRKIAGFLKTTFGIQDRHSA